MQPTLIQAMVEELLTMLVDPITVEVALHHQQMHLRHHYHNKRCLQIMSATDVSNLDITSEIARQMTIKHSTLFKVRVCRENISWCVPSEFMRRCFLITSLKSSGRLWRKLAYTWPVNCRLNYKTLVMSLLRVRSKSLKSICRHLSNATYVKVWLRMLVWPNAAVRYPPARNVFRIIW